MIREQLPPPAPEVQHLPTLLRRVQSGEIRVPAFQREYVWTEKQIIELLESLYKGYPIGSLLFWQPTNLAIKIKLDAEFPIPQSAEKQPATFILDGQQRVATIYNCFYRLDQKRPDRFNVTFDLRKQTFQHFRQGDKPSGRLHLGSLFSPRAFLQVQQSLAQEPDSEMLLDRSIALHATFQEYMIPIVNIKGRETADVVNVFERVNNTGVRLGAVDFMRAVTWSEDFDLSDEAERLNALAETKGFSLPPETLVKILAISQGFDPTPESMLRLRELTAAQLHDAVETVNRALIGSIDFLQRQLAIFSYDYVPYEAQMLVIAKLFIGSGLKPSKDSIAVIRRWFLRVSIDETLQGKADSVISNLVRSVDSLVSGDAKSFEGRPERSAEDLVGRKFIARRALSSTLAILFAQREARSVVTGEVIPTDEYMRDFVSQHFVPVLDTEAVKSVTKSPDRKVFANMVLVSEEDRRALKARSIQQYLLSPTLFDGASEAARSQMISREALAALSEGNSQAFLLLRARDVLAGLAELLAKS
jgi:hypothetical protein